MKKNASQNIIIKSGIWYIVSNFVLKGLDFLTIPLFARMMSSEDMGNYNNLVSWVQIIITISSMSLFSSLLTAQFDYKDDLNSYMTSLLLVGTINAMIFALIVSANPYFFEKTLSINSGLIYYILIYAAVRPAFDIFQQHEKLFYHYKRSVILTAATTVCTVITSIIFVSFFKNKFIGRAIGAYASFIVIGIILYIIFIIKGHQVKLEYIKYAFKICIPMVPHLLAMTVLSSTDRIMILKFCGPTDTALYSIAYTCALAISVLWTSLNGAFAPWLGDMLHEKKYSAIKKVSQKYVFLFALITLIIIIFSPELLFILGGKEYMSAKYIIPPIMMGCYFQFLYSMYVNIEQFCKKTVGMAIVSVIAAIINIVLNAFFIPTFGYVAAAYTTLIGYAFLLLFHYILVKKMDMAQIYDTRFIAGSIIIEVLMTVAITLLFTHNVMRWILGAVIIISVAIIFINNREKILTSFKK